MVSGWWNGGGPVGESVIGGRWICGTLVRELVVSFWWPPLGRWSTCSEVGGRLSVVSRRWIGGEPFGELVIGCRWSGVL